MRHWPPTPAPPPLQHWRRRTGAIGRERERRHNQAPLRPLRRERGCRRNQALPRPLRRKRGCRCRAREEGQPSVAVTPLTRAREEATPSAAAAPPARARAQAQPSTAVAHPTRAREEGHRPATELSRHGHCQDKGNRSEGGGRKGRAYWSKN